MSKTVDMTRGNPAKHILTFALPLIVTNIGQQLYMIADAAIVGRGVGVQALAAVGALVLDRVQDRKDIPRIVAAVSVVGGMMNAFL